MLLGIYNSDITKTPCQTQHKVTQERDDTEHSIRQRDTTIFELESHISRLEADISRTRDEIDAYQRKQIESDVKYQTLVNHHREDAERDNGQVASLQKELEIAKKQADKSKALADSNIRQVKKKNKELNEYLAQVAQANKTLDETRDRMRQLEIDFQRKSDELDGIKNARVSKSKALQIENDKLRMDLSNQTNHGHTLEVTIQNLEAQLAQAQDTQQQQKAQQAAQLLSELNKLKVQLSEASQEKGSLEEQNFKSGIISYFYYS